MAMRATAFKGDELPSAEAIGTQRRKHAGKCNLASHELLDMTHGIVHPGWWWWHDRNMYRICVAFVE